MLKFFLFLRLCNWSFSISSSYLWDFLCPTFVLSNTYAITAMIISFIFPLRFLLINFCSFSTFTLLESWDSLYLSTKVSFDQIMFCFYDFAFRDLAISSIFPMRLILTNCDSFPTFTLFKSRQSLLSLICWFFWPSYVHFLRLRYLILGNHIIFPVRGFWPKFCSFLTLTLFESWQSLSCLLWSFFWPTFVQFLRLRYSCRGKFFLLSCDVSFDQLYSFVTFGLVESWQSLSSLVCRFFWKTSVLCPRFCYLSLFYLYHFSHEVIFYKCLLFSYSYDIRDLAISFIFLMSFYLTNLCLFAHLKFLVPWLNPFRLSYEVSFDQL